MSHSGRSGHQRRLDVRMKDEEARKAQQLANKLACEAWNARLAQLGGPLQPSPSLRAAIHGGFPWRCASNATDASSQDGQDKPEQCKHCALTVRDPSS